MDAPPDPTPNPAPEAAPPSDAPAAVAAAKPQGSLLQRLLKNEWVGLFLFLAFLGAPITAIGVALTFVAADDWAKSNPRMIPVTGEAARREVLAYYHRPDQTGRDGAPPESAGDFYYCRDRIPSKQEETVYWSFRCDSKEACRQAVETLLGPRRGELGPWRPSAYAVVWNGPGFLPDAPPRPWWNVRQIQSGLVFEQAAPGFGSLEYYAVDFDALRVYGLNARGELATAPADAPLRREKTPQQGSPAAGSASR